MELDIDTSGNIRVGSDTSSTSAKHFAIYLAALTSHISEVSYSQTSSIKDASYDPETGVLSWLENGSEQTYSMNTPDLDAFTKTSFNYGGDLQPIEDLLLGLHTTVDSIKEHLDRDLRPTEQLILGVKNTVDTCLEQIYSTQSLVSDAQTALSDEMDGVEGKVDLLQSSVTGTEASLRGKIEQMASSVEVNEIYDSLRDHISGERHAVVNNIHAVEAKVDAIQADSNLGGDIAKLMWLAARCQMQRLDVLASLSLSKKKLDDYTVKAPEIRPDRMPTNETVNTFILSH